MRDETTPLVELWHPDDFSAGYMHPELVVRACELESPPGVAAIAAVFYMGVKFEDLDADAVEVIRDGYALYQRRLNLGRRAGVVDRVNRALGR